MGLDIYSGTLTRYYSHNWKTITQQLSEEHGQRCVLRDNNGNEIKPIEDKEEIEEIRDIIYQWSGSLAPNIDPTLPTPLWDENKECDYFTDKPGWEAYGALLMLQACRLLNLPLPNYIESGWNAFNDPIVKKAMSLKYNYSLLHNVTFWLPVPKKIVFSTTLPTEYKACFSTLLLLKEELEDLNQQIWKADDATILSWRNDKFYVPINRKEPKPILGFIQNKTPKDRYCTEDLAQCAYSMLYQAVCFATEEQVPILLDY